MYLIFGVTVFYFECSLNTHVSKLSHWHDKNIISSLNPFLKSLCRCGIWRTLGASNEESVTE